MNEVLKIFLSLSLSGSVLIVGLLIAKSQLRARIGKAWQYYIWLIVVARLLLPFAPPSSPIGNLFGGATPAVSQAQNSPQSVHGASGAVGMETVPKDSLDNNRAGIDGENSVIKTTQGIIDVAWQYIWLVWLVTALVLLIRKATIYQSFVRYICAGRVEVTDINLLEQFGKIVEKSGVNTAVDIYTNSLISSPILIGFFRPCIVLPRADLSEIDFEYTIKHELVHFRRGDMFYKWLVQLAVCVHWFNPLVYLMAREISRLCELACDEAVIEKLDGECIRGYGDTLLTAIGTSGSYKESLASVTLNESKELLKERLDAINEYSKQKKRGRLAAIILALLIFAVGYGLGAYNTSAGLIMPKPNNQNGLNDAYGLTVYVGGEDISRETVSLWHSANNIYSVDDNDTFQMGDTVFLFDTGPEFNELLNYDQEVDAVFTAGGKAQLEKTMIGGGYTLIQKREGRVYRMGSWKTGYSYADALEGMRVLNFSLDTLVLEVKYREQAGTEDPPTFGYANFTIKRIDGLWYVESYDYPEAYHGEATAIDGLEALKPDILPALQGLVKEYESGSASGVDFPPVPEYCHLPEVQTIDDFVLGKNEMGLTATIVIDSEWQMDVLVSSFDGSYQASGAGFNIIPNSFMDKAMSRGLSFSQVRTLISSSFTEEEILTLPVAELEQLFSQLSATNKLDDRGFVTLGYTELIDMKDSHHAFVYAGDLFLGLKVVEAQTIGIPYSVYVMEAESLVAVTEGELSLVGSFRNEGDTLIFTVAEESRALAPTSTISPSVDIVITNAEQAAGMLGSVVAGGTVKVILNAYSISYSSQLSLATNGDPLVESPQCVQRATLLEVG